MTFGDVLASRSVRTGPLALGLAGALTWLTPALAIAQRGDAPARETREAESRRRELAPGVGRADGADHDASGAVVPPVVIEPPADADALHGPSPAALPEGVVVLSLTIDRGGALRDARVIESSGHDGLDRAALAHARRCRFEPATSAGVPVAARIRYRFVSSYALAVGDTSPTATARDSAEAPSVVGASGGGEDPAHAAPGSTRRGARAGDVPATPDAEDPSRSPSDPSPSDPSPSDPSPSDPSSQAMPRFGARASARRPSREQVRRSLDVETLRRLPGTRGDPLRGVELLPGVGRPPLSAGVILVRGAAPQDSQVFLDGAPVPLLYHFGGLTSFVQSRFLDRIELYPGNFSVRYGRKLGGVLEVATRAPYGDALHGALEVNLLDASLAVEGPVGDDVQVAIAARRSYVDALLGAFVPSDSFDLVVAPYYYDYQALARVGFGPATELRLAAYGSGDTLRLLLSDAVDSDPAIRGQIDVATSFHRAAATLRHRFSRAAANRLEVTFGPTRARIGVGDALALETDTWQLTVRDELEVRLSRRVGLVFGVDVFASPFDFRYRGPAPRVGEGNARPRDPLTTSDVVTTRASGSVVQPAIYVEERFSLAPVTVVAGLRVDHDSRIDATTFDPRVVVEHAFSDATRASLGAGLFSQPPQFQETDPALGNPLLRPARALHLGLGVEHDLGVSLFGGEVRRGLALASASVFYKELYDLVVAPAPTADAASSAGARPFENGGRGRIAGLELESRLPLGRRTYVLGSYTLSRSQRRDHPNAPVRLFDYDQTHVLALAGLVRLGDGWELGAAFRLVSGNPYTPVVGAEFDAAAGVYVPLYGATNSGRNPLFHRLDARLEKKWRHAWGSIAVHLDVLNVYNHVPAEGEVFQYDYRRRGELPGLPILPSLGVRGEL